MGRIRLTDAKAAKLAVPAKGQTFYRDQELVGFALRVTAGGARSWVFEANGKRRTIGAADKMACKEARELARTPWTAKRTLAQAWEEYQGSRPLRPVTVADYRFLLERYSPAGWWSRPVDALTSAMVVERYRSIKSRSQAERWARVLRALLRFAGHPQATAGLRIPPTKRRRTVLRPEDIGPWWQATEALRQRDLLRLLLLTGLRTSEALALRREHVEAGYLPTSKNGDPRVLVFGTRALVLVPEQGFAIRSFRTALRQCGPWCAHDLRRTYATVAESLDISMLTIKRLLGHRTAESDVTAGYVVPSLARLRAAAQRVEDEIMRLADFTTSP